MAGCLFAAGFLLEDALVPSVTRLASSACCAVVARVDLERSSPDGQSSLSIWVFHWGSGPFFPPGQPSHDAVTLVTSSSGRADL